MHNALNLTEVNTEPLPGFYKVLLLSILHANKGTFTIDAQVLDSLDEMLGDGITLKKDSAGNLTITLA